MSKQRNHPFVTQELCEAFAHAADALMRRGAGEISERAIEDFVALRWMDWHGGSLRLTQLGQMALLRIRNRLVDAVA